MRTAGESSTEDEVLTIVRQVAIQHGLRHDIGPMDSLVDRGMTSLALVDLILALETRFDVTIPPCKLTTSNLRSVASLGELVGRP